MSCEACEAARAGRDTSGLVHRCGGSGTFLAAEAHAAGEVDEIAETWPIFATRLSFRMRGADEHMVRERLTPLVAALLEDDMVLECEFTIEAEAAL